MKAEKSKETDETQIRGLVENREKAVRAKDINALMSSQAPDILAFDLINPLQYIGLDALRKRAEEWLSSFEGPLGFEISDLGITASNGVAFCHCLNHVNGTTTAGQKIDMWWRATICLRKIDDKWMVTHEHNSVPFDMESGKASLGLKP
jgi:ketosteroid isomerase-like protein